MKPNHSKKMHGGSTASDLVMQNLTLLEGGECKMTTPPNSVIGGDPSNLNLYATSGGGRRTKRQQKGGASDYISSFYAVEAGKVDPNSMHGPDNATIEAYNSDPNLMGSTYAAVGGSRKSRKSRKTKNKSKKSRKH